MVLYNWKIIYWEQNGVLAWTTELQLHTTWNPLNTVQADGLYERLGVKLNIYRIHKQLKEPLSSIIYSAAAFAESASTAFWQLIVEHNSNP